jgi:hypothetical protein
MNLATPGVEQDDWVDCHHQTSKGVYQNPKYPDGCLSLSAFLDRLDTCQEVCGATCEAPEDLLNTCHTAGLYHGCSAPGLPGPCWIICGRACCSQGTPSSYFDEYHGPYGLSDCRAPHSDVPRVVRHRMAPRLVLVRPRHPTRFASVHTPKNCRPLVSMRRVSTCMLPAR